MPDQVDPIIEQRRVQRQLLAIGQHAIHTEIKAGELPADLDAERELRRHADLLLEGEAGDWLKGQLAADTARAARMSLVDVTVVGTPGDRHPTADALQEVINARPHEFTTGRTSDEPARSVLEYIAVAIAADRLSPQ